MKDIESAHACMQRGLVCNLNSELIFLGYGSASPTSIFREPRKPFVRRSLLAFPSYFACLVGWPPPAAAHSSQRLETTFTEGIWPAGPKVNCNEGREGQRQTEIDTLRR